MDTYWLTCKEGGVNRTNDAAATKYLPVRNSSKVGAKSRNFQFQDEDSEPIFMRRIRGECYV